MYRGIFLPAALLMVIAIGTAGFLLFDCFHRQFEMTWSKDKAYTGDIPSQRHLASCYMTGCPRVPLDHAFSCAWRKIIAGEIPQVPIADNSAQRKACSHLSAFDEKWVPDLEADIRNQMHRIKALRSSPAGSRTAASASL
jgi:hypothetical protein